MPERSFIIIAAIAILTVFLGIISILRYAVPDRFTRNRLIMTLFFCFIVVTLTLSFWEYALTSLIFTIPAVTLGAVVGHFVGVKEAQEKLMLQGAEHYMEHFAHIHFEDVKNFQWWSLINFYTVAGALLLINFVGLSTVIFRGTQSWAIATCVFGAFLLGTVAPYLIHLWSIKAPQNTSSTTSEA